MHLGSDGKGFLEIFSGISFSAEARSRPAPSPSASPPKELSYREIAKRLTDADAIISDPATIPPITKAFDRPDFKRLKAVREGHLIHLRPAYLCASQILANLQLLEGLLQKLGG